MAMEVKQWEKILSAVDKDDVIEKIKEELKVEDKNEYEKWEGAGFDVNYLFEV